MAGQLKTFIFTVSEASGPFYNRMQDHLSREKTKKAFREPHRNNSTSQLNSHKLAHSHDPEDNVAEMVSDDPDPRNENFISETEIVYNSESYMCSIALANSDSYA